MFWLYPLHEDLSDGSYSGCRRKSGDRREAVRGLRELSARLSGRCHLCALRQPLSD